MIAPTKQFAGAPLLRGGLLLALLCLLPLARAYQNDPTFRHLSLEHGLSQSSVYCILQDRTGYLWFGTADGLNRFDGYGFSVFRHSADDSTSISENSITALCEDSLGALWIGTMAGGLNRLVPGSARFKRFSPDADGRALLGDGRVRALCTDPFGRVWVGMQGGTISVMDPQAADFFSSGIAPRGVTPLPEHAVRSILPDSAGLWVGTDGAGLWRLDWSGAAKNTLHLRGPQELGIPASMCQRIEEIFLDRSAHLWVGTMDEGVYRWEVRDGRFSDQFRFSSRPADPQSLTGDVVQAFCEDPSGGVWIGTWEGLNLVRHSADGSTNRSVHRFLHSATDPRTLSHNTVHAILVDRSGVMWVGTRGGGVSYRETAPPKFRLYKHDPFRPKGFPGGQVRAIVTDADGFWVGTTGGGIAHITHATGEVLALRHHPAVSASLGSNDVRTLAIDREGVLWVGTYGAGLVRVLRNRSTGTIRAMRFDTGPSTSNQVFAFLQDRHDRYWVGTQNGIVQFRGVDRSGRKPAAIRHWRSNVDDSTRISHRIVRLLFEDSRGIIWAGTYGGLDRIDPPSDRVKSYRAVPDKPGSISHNVVVAACEDAAGFIWFGTMGGGLNRFDPRTDSFVSLDERSGLPNSYVYGILRDGEGSLWLSSNRGLTRFQALRWHPGMAADSTAGLFRSYSVKDGLQSNEYNAGASWADASGELYFGGIGGLNSFFPSDVRDIDVDPTVLITGFQVFDRRIDLDSAVAASGVLHLTFSQNYFSVEAASLDFAHPESNRYAFLLEGFDEEWRNAGTRRYAAYTNLAHGEYTLRVRGTNRDGVWSSREAALRLNISPPYWHTWWFRSVAVTLIALAVAGALTIRRRVKRNEQMARQRFLRQLIESQEGERKRIAAELHDSLGQNLLLIKNRALLGLGDESGAREQFQEISGLASRTIREVREISYDLRPYQLDRLGLTKAIRAACRQVEESTQIDLTAAVEIIDGLVPQDLEINVYRIVQEGLTNIVKHAQASAAGVIIRRVDRSVVIEISDNGRGFTPSAHGQSTGLGLSGIRERASMLGGTAEITSSPGNGTRASVEIPIPKGHHS